MSDKLHCYVVVAPQTTVVIPDEVQLHVIMCKECHKRIHTMLADLQMYHVTWKQGTGHIKFNCNDMIMRLDKLS